MFLQRKYVANGICATGAELYASSRPLWKEFVRERAGRDLHPTPKNAQTFMKLVRQLDETYNQTFLIVTHDPIVSKECNAIYIIRDGEISKSE